MGDTVFSERNYSPVKNVNIISPRCHFSSYTIETPSFTPSTLSSTGVRQTQTADFADWQVNEENRVVECFNRVPIPKV